MFGLLFLLNIILVGFLIILPFFHSIFAFIEHQKKLALGPENDFDEDSGYLDEDFLDQPKSKRQTSYPEILLMGIAPPFGLVLVYGFERDITPYALDYFPSLAVYLLIAYLSYWLSKYYNKEFQIEANLILNFGMLTGCLIYPFMAIHSISEMTLLGAAIFPYLAFPLFAPLPALLFTFRQLEVHQKFISRQIQETEINSLNVNSIRWFNNMYKMNSPVGWLGLAIFLMVIQSLLGFFGQPANAVFLAFLHGSEFFYSLN